ncbi:hypothetical protein [Desulforamulus reducens]|uniref:hypothetical protein n=1 Tax=Desulforamulus reducens TaxID=59610 RepID=UPI00031D84D0|nr:hypothetical protein [Desulforamulus reducens]
MSDTSKPSIFKTIIFLVVALCAYLVIFFNIESLNKFYLSKSVVPAICLLGTIVFIAFTYGTAMSYILNLLGLESDH